MLFRSGGGIGRASDRFDITDDQFGEYLLCLEDHVANIFGDLFGGPLAGLVAFVKVSPIIGFIEGYEIEGAAGILYALHGFEEALPGKAFNILAAGVIRE